MKIIFYIVTQTNIDLKINLILVIIYITTKLKRIEISGIDAEAEIAKEN